MNALSETMLASDGGLATRYMPNFAYARAQHARRGQRSLRSRATVFGLVALAQVGLIATLALVDFGKRMPMPEAILMMDLAEATVLPPAPPPAAPKFVTPQVITPEVQITLAPPPPTAITLPPPPPTPTPEAVGTGHNVAATIAAYQESLLRHLARHKRYPAEARARQRQGVALVRFTMDRAGNVMTVVLAKSSGASALDNESLALLRRAAPMPAPPADVRGNPIDLVVPVEFTLR